MNPGKRNQKKIPIELLAARKTNRDIERLLFGEGFHVRTKIKKSKKLYSRNRKHRNRSEE